MNLFGQFTGGGDYQGANAAVFFPHQSIEYRQNESRRFTGTGLGQTHYITTFYYLRDCPGLYRGRGFIAHRCRACGNRGMKIKCFKVQLIPSFGVQIKKAPDNSGAYVIFSYNQEHCKFVEIIQAAGNDVKVIFYC
jgi:hypothetical protein